MKNTKYNTVVIDISKDTFDVALLKNNKLDESNKFTNDSKGFKKLFLWLKSKNININKILFCAEKTGIYSIRIARYISEKKCKLWSEDPIKISRSEGFKRGKNDKIDAIRIAKYTLRFQDNMQLFQFNNKIYDKLNSLFSTREKLISIESKGIFDEDIQKTPENICSPFIASLKLGIKNTDKKLDNLLKENLEVNEKYKITS